MWLAFWFPDLFWTKIDSNLHVFAYFPLIYTRFSRFVLSSVSEKPASTSATSACLVRFCICFDTLCCLAGLLSCCFDTFPLLGHLFVPSLPRVFILARDFRSLFSFDCFLSHSDLYLFVVIKELARGRTLSPESRNWVEVKAQWWHELLGWATLLLRWPLYKVSSPFQGNTSCVSYKYRFYFEKKHHGNAASVSNISSITTPLFSRVLSLAKLNCVCPRCSSSSSSSSPEANQASFIHLRMQPMKYLCALRH